MSKQISLKEAFKMIEKEDPQTTRLTDLEKSISNYGNAWQSKENTAALQKKIHFEKMRAAFNSDDKLIKKLDDVQKNIDAQFKLYSKFKSADEYNIAVKNQGYADKYKNYTYQQIDKLLNSDNYKTMRRRGIIDESEALWLKNQKYALATAKEVESELKNKKALFAGNRTNENLDFNFNQPKKVFKEADLTQLLDETKVKNEEWSKSKGYKNYAEYLREYPNFEGEIEVLETVLAQKKKQENFNEKWGDVNVEGGYTPKINKNEPDNLYGQINNIVPDGWIKEKDTKTKAKYVRDRAVTDADYIAEMSPQEKAKYNKIYDTQGIKKANEYYEDLVSLSLDKRVNEKEFQKAYDFTSSGGLNAVIGNIKSVGDSLSSGVEFVANNLMGETNKRVVSATRSQGFREGTKTHWDGAWGEKVWDFLYDTGMSGVDSAAAAGLSAVVPYLGEVLLGGSAAASTYNDALDRGISHGDAMLTALTVGVAESLFEHMSISKFLDAGDITKGFTKSGLRQATKTLLTEMGINFSEEFFTEVSNITTDTAINGNLSNYAIAVKDYYMQGMSPEEAKNKALADFGKQILEAGASGALMGFGFGSISSIKGMAHSQVLNSRNGGLVKLSGNLAELKTVAELSNNEEIKAAAEKLTETSKPSEIGYVYNSLVADAVEQSVSEMTPVLLENGAKESGSNSAKGWATQIANSLFDKNEGKKAELSINKVTSEVYSDFTTEGKYGGDKLLNLKDIISTPYLNQKTTASEVGTVLNENGVEVPVAADGSGAAIGPVTGDTVKGIAAAPRSGEIRTITEAYKQGVAENLEKQRPNPKTMSEEEIMKTYFAEEVQISPEEEEVLKDFGKANGLEVEFVDGAVNGKGYGVFQNGKQIVISRYAKKPMAALFKHEFTHSIEKAKGYAKFQKYVLEESKAFKEWLNVKGFADWAALSNSIVKNYEKSGVDYEDPYIKAKADIIADFVGDVLFGEVVDAKGNPIKLDTNFLVELKKNDRNLFQRFVEWVHSILKRLTTKGVVNKDIVKLEQKFKRLVEQARQQRAKGESKQSEGGYSLPDVDNLSEKQYNNFGWVRVNDVLTAAEYNALMSNYTGHKHKDDNFPITRFGETVLHSFKYNNILMYAKGSIDNPQITKVVKIKTDDYTASKIKEWILRNEYQQVYEPYKSIEFAYGEEVFRKYRKRDSISFQEYQSKRERNGSQTGDTFGGAEQNRTGSPKQNKRTDRTDSIDGSVYSLPDIDAEYMKAVESGDTETQQRLVDEAAEKAGYTINAYHGTPDSRNLVYNKITGSIDVKGDFSIFDSSKSRADRVDGSAFFFTNNEKVAKFYSPEQGYKPKVYNSKLKIVNPLFVECNGANWNEIPFDKLAYSYPTPNGGVKTTNKVTTKDIAQYARENGYDGVVFENIIDGKADTSENIGTVYAVFSSNQIKSADPVTYDDKGNVIPLSERFKNDNNDIRYSLPDIDSSGHKLSAGQMEYFKDSKVKDEYGNLLVLYHGTSDGGYTVFDPKYSDDKKSIFLTDDIQTANSYIREQKYHDKILKTPSKKPDALKWLEGDPTKSKNKKGLYKVYANIKNPLVVDCKGSSWNEIPFGKNDVYEVSYADGKVTIKELNSGKTETQAFTDAEIEAEVKPKEYFEKLFNAEEAERLTWFLKIKPKNATNRSILGNFTWDGNRVTAGDSTRSISKFAKEQGYDGVIFKNVRDYGAGLKPKEIDAEGTGKNVYVVFDSNQIKSVNNTNPTEDKDIRYSLPDIPDIARGKSNEELDKLVSEGKITTKQALDAAREEHGTMPKGENPKVDVDVPNKVSDTKGVRRFARTALESGHLTEGMSEDAKREIINGALNYEISSNKMVTNIAEKKVAKDINKAIQEWEGLMASGKIPTAEDIALGEVLLVEAAKAGNANDVAMYLAEIAALGTQLGQGIQALSLLKKLTGVGQLHYISRVIAQMNEDLKRRYGDKFQDVLSIDPNLEEILAKSKNQAEIEEVIDDILTDVAKQMPSTWLDKFNAWRYLAMLGNTRTHIRNFLGNAIFLPAIRIKDALGTIGERMFIKDASHRTKVFKVNKKYREYAMKDFEEVKGLLTRGGKMNPSDIVQDRRKIFTSKLFAPVEKFRKFNFDMLEAEDLIFLKKHYIHALGSVLQSRGLDVNNITEQQLKDARDYAINEAQKATYRDFSFFANMLNKLAHPTKNGKPVRDVATKGLAVLIEGALPFKKTPINILKRGIEYSPLGIATTFGNAIIAGRRGEFSGAEFIDGITSGMTGTMILGLGMLLQSMGWLVGGLGYDDEDALERLSGAQPYAIDFGDWSYTIDWMAPSSLPLLIGAEISKALDKEEGQISDLLLAIAEPMTELSFLQGVNDIIEGVAYSGENGLGVTGEVVTNLASTYVSQYFPTLTGQVARTFDDTRRANFVDKSSAVPKTLQKTAQKILGKIPFAENQKIPYIDAWGRTEENGNVLLRVFENFVSPGYVSKIEDDKVNNELAKVYTNTGESGVIPKKAGTSFSVNGKMVYLDAEKYVQYATDKGQYSRKYLEEMMSGGLYNGLSSDGKAEAIAFLFSYANAKAKSNVSDYDYREVSTYKTAAKLEDAGISPASYAVAKFAMSKENADTDGSDSVSKSEKQKALRNAGFSSREANKILNINKK